jgi:hypothetical protein
MNLILYISILIAINFLKMNTKQNPFKTHFHLENDIPYLDTKFDSELTILKNSIEKVLMDNQQATFVTVYNMPIDYRKYLTKCGFVITDNKDNNNKFAILYNEFKYYINFTNWINYPIFKKKIDLMYKEKIDAEFKDVLDTFKSRYNTSSLTFNYYKLLMKDTCNKLEECNISIIYHNGSQRESGYYELTCNF